MRTRLALLAVALGPLLAGPAAAQVCSTENTTVAAAVDYGDYDVAGGLTGIGVGADAVFTVGSLTTRLEYRHVLLEGDGADPDALRATSRFPTVEIAGVLACPEVHAGLTGFGHAGDAGLVLVGGLGATLTIPRDGPFQPYLSVRGLGGFTTGRVLGEQINAVGLAAGVEAGVEASLGPLSARLRIARDGFDGGLGVTPYPNTAVGLALGYRF